MFVKFILKIIKPYRSFTNKYMDYNKFNYYRANPYSKEGFLPPRAQKNRINADFLSNLPQGSQDFIYNRRRHFREHSNIEQYQIFNHDESPINQHKTIGIQGSTSSPLTSPALKNKYIAQKQITKRQKSMDNYEEIKKQQQLSEQNVKKSLEDEYKRNKHMFQLISGRDTNQPSPRQKLQNHSYEYEYPNERVVFERKLYERQHNMNGSQVQSKKQNPEYSNRRNSPTYLSSENSFLMAGKNLMNV